MRCLAFGVATALLALRISAAERTFNFGDFPIDQSPTNFRNVVVGNDRPGEWKVLLDEEPPLLEPLTPKAPSLTRRAVLAQDGRDPDEHHFPMLVFDRDSYGDFELTTRFKIVGGAAEQVAGIVFHFQNRSNFYVVCASALANTFRCYKIQDGVFRPPLGVDTQISKGAWHELTVRCDGPRITCSLDGVPAIKLIDNAWGAKAGKIGFWTKSDSVSYFGDTRITYQTREILAQTLVREMARDYPRLLDLKVFAIQTNGGLPSVVGSKDEKEIGQAGGKVEGDVINRGTSYYGKQQGTVLLILPLRDRNGDPIAAVRLVMKSFPGQTEDNAVVRARPIVKQMQARVQTLEELLR